MDDLISRQAAINLLMDWSGGYDYIETETAAAIKEFQQLPSVDAPDIKFGEWIAYGLELMEKYTTLITGQKGEKNETD